MEWVDFDLSRGSAPILRFRLLEPPLGGVGGWTTQLEFRLDERDDSNTVYSAAGSITNTSFVPNSTVIGCFDCPMTVADTRLFTIGRTYHYRFKRTNTDAEDVLTRGRMKVI